MSKTTQHPCQSIRDALCRGGLYQASPHTQTSTALPSSPVTNHWRLATGPLLLSAADAMFFESLGQHLLAFYQALNRLYLESVRGDAPTWVAAYLDQGKPESLVTYARMKRFREHLPAVIRPDIIPTDRGMVITELDSVPGGIGLTGALSHVYADEGPEGLDLVGGRDGMVQGFCTMLRAQMGDASGHVAIVVSEESRDYRPEMRWMAEQLRAAGLDASCVEPREVSFTEEGLTLGEEGRQSPIAVLYRFFELFDLKNIPKSELFLYSAKKDRVTVTPPFKPVLEEKLAFALLHHPGLRTFWQRVLGEQTFSMLSDLIPRTWILDPSPVPPTAVIPDLQIAGEPVRHWGDLHEAPQKDRQYVVKPSGFSELAWGSRGVSVGHDLSQEQWAATLEHALTSFSHTPYILQEFHKGRQVEWSYYDQTTEDLVPMAGRARLSPYYFVSGGRAELGGVLATVCPLDKKLIHGMRDAIMGPCATASRAR